MIESDSNGWHSYRPPKPADRPARNKRAPATRWAPLANQVAATRRNKSSRPRRGRPRCGTTS